MTEQCPTATFFYNILNSHYIAEGKKSKFTPTQPSSVPVSAGFYLYNLKVKYDPTTKQMGGKLPEGKMSEISDAYGDGLRACC